METLFRYSVKATTVLITALIFAGQVLAFDQPVGISGVAQTAKEESNVSEVQTTMQIRVTADNKITVFELNNSQAARDLYAQLPMSVKVENYSDNEKIFYPPKKLNTSDTPQADARAGSLAYYAPWGDVVMFYENFGAARGLYELGQAVTGIEHIHGMTGTIQVEKAPSP